MKLAPTTPDNMGSRYDESESSSSEDDESDVGDSSGSGVGTIASADNSETSIGKQETKEVLRQKLVVLLVLLVSAIATSVTVYHYVASNEDEQFHLKFDDDAHKLLEAVGVTMDRLLGAFDSVAVTLVSYSHLANKTWPFVTVPDFAHRMSKLLPLSDALYINVLPVVSPAELEDWEQYSVANDQWVNECITLQDSWEGYFGEIDYQDEPIQHIHGDSDKNSHTIGRIMLPTWQKFPVLAKTKYTYNYDWLSSKRNNAPISCMETKLAIVSKPYMVSQRGEAEYEEETDLAKYLKNFIRPEEEAFEPVSDLWYPIIDTTNKVAAEAGIEEYNTTENKVVGVIGSTFYWRDTFNNVLPPDSNGIHIVVTNPCSNAFTYQIMGEQVVFLGVGDLHEPAYNHHGVSDTLYDLEKLALRGMVYTGAKMNKDFCPITLSMYPSSVMQKTFTTSNGPIFAGAAICIFAFTSLVFYLYDLKVEQRQKHVLNKAVRSSAIVSSLFPSAVRDRLYPVAEEPAKNKLEALIPETAKGKLQSFLRDGKSSTPLSVEGSSAPIAELYPETTVLFADIAGFTAWSSERQPTQVFHLLETVYAAFDEIAKRRGVFKVETIGDSYVAVVGLPTPRKHHAVVMTRFANDCRIKMNELTHDLDKVLGPGTADLCMRFGLNSGPTTAGVLRGEKSRFQLFGDTVNTAARMESNGERNRIQVSQKTAELLKLAGKSHWLTSRKDKVDCKGKGMMSTFWCNPNAGAASGSATSQSDTGSSQDENSVLLPDVPPTSVVNSHDRLIDWNYDLFRCLLQDVVIHRSTTKQTSSMNKLPVQKRSMGMPINEVTEVIALSKAKTEQNKSTKVPEVPSSASAQLRELIASIAKMYRSNPFHNFDHCSHVVMFTKKLLGRIAEQGLDSSKMSQCVEKSSYAITSNPLTQFAIVFAALIHDVDHQGVSNAQLVEEKSALAATYQGKSVAEQNSVDVAWNLLMEERFADLRACIFPTEIEFGLFRQVVINSVMATDLFDKDLKALRDSRWQKSFHEKIKLGSAPLTEDDANRRATIVIVLIIQASDVSHTMQYFTVYKKWNRNLLIEMYDAYQNGRTTKNPLDGWYEGELWFFDNYVIPLAQKLRECGVFGVACDEFLDYAKDNRMEWEVKGRDIVRDIEEELKSRVVQEPAPSGTQQELDVPVVNTSRYFL